MVAPYRFSSSARLLAAELLALDLVQVDLALDRRVSVPEHPVALGGAQHPARDPLVASR